MPVAIGDKELFEAVNNTLALVHEFDQIEDKLAVFGLRVDDVHHVLQERWAAYVAATEHTEAAHVIFVKSYVEGLLTGMQLVRRG